MKAADHIFLSSKSLCACNEVAAAPTDDELLAELGHDVTQSLASSTASCHEFREADSDFDRKLLDQLGSWSSSNASSMASNHSSATHTGQNPPASRKYQELIVTHSRNYGMSGQMHKLDYVEDCQVGSSPRTVFSFPSSCFAHFENHFN